MARRMTSTKEVQFELGYVFEKMVKGMRNEMSTVLWKIERSRDLSPEAIRGMLKNGLESMVGAVEKVMNGVSDGIAKEWRAREKEDKEAEERARKTEDRRVREERDREERERKMEERLKGEAKDREQQIRKLEERLKKMEERVEKKDLEEKVRRMSDSIYRDRKDREEDTKETKNKIKRIEEMLLEGKKATEQENGAAQENIGKMESEIAKERQERKVIERKVEKERIIHETMESEKEMERKVGAAMEQCKIINIDFGTECNDRNKLVGEAVRKLNEQVGSQDKEEFKRIMKGTRVSILGSGTTVKEMEKGKIHTVPVLLICQCRSTKERLENILKNAGIFVAFQWPKEMMAFVQGIREKVEGMGFERKDHFTRVRPTSMEGTIYVRADVKKKEGGSFKKVAFWRIPPLDEAKWRYLRNFMEPEWTVGKRQ